MNEPEIQIEGLTVRQKALAQAIWEINSLDQVNAFIQSLPDQEARQDAETVKNLILAATLDVFTTEVKEAQAELRRLGLIG